MWLRGEVADGGPLVAVSTEYDGVVCQAPKVAARESRLPADEGDASPSRMSESHDYVLSINRSESRICVSRVAMETASRVRIELAVVDRR